MTGTSIKYKFYVRNQTERVEFDSTQIIYALWDTSFSQSSLQRLISYRVWRRVVWYILAHADDISNLTSLRKKKGDRKLIFTWKVWTSYQITRCHTPKDINLRNSHKCH